MAKVEQVRPNDYYTMQYKCVRFEKAVPRRVSKYPSIERLAGTDNFTNFSFKLKFPSSNRQLVRSIRLCLPIRMEAFTQKEPANLIDPGMQRVSFLEADPTMNDQCNIALGENILSAFRSIECFVNGTKMSTNNDWIKIIDVCHADGASNEFGPKPIDGNLKPIANYPLTKVWTERSMVNRIQQLQHPQIADERVVIHRQPSEVVLGVNTNNFSPSFQERQRAFLDGVTTDYNVASGKNESVFDAVLICDLDIGIFQSRMRKQATGKLYKNEGYPFLKEIYLNFQWDGYQCDLENQVKAEFRAQRSFTNKLFQISTPIYFGVNKSKHQADVMEASMLEHRNTISNMRCIWSKDPYIQAELVSFSPPLNSYALQFPTQNMFKSDIVRGVDTDNLPSLRLQFRTPVSPSLIYIWAAPDKRFSSNWLQGGMLRTYMLKNCKVRIGTESGCIFNLGPESLYEYSQASMTNQIPFTQFVDCPILVLNTNTLGCKGLQDNAYQISSIEITTDLSLGQCFKNEIDMYDKIDSFFVGYELDAQPIYKNSLNQDFYLYGAASQRIFQATNGITSQNYDDDIDQECTTELEIIAEWSPTQGQIDVHNDNHLVGMELLIVSDILWFVRKFGKKKQIEVTYPTNGEAAELGIETGRILNVNPSNCEIVVTGGFEVISPQDLGSNAVVDENNQDWTAFGDRILGDAHFNGDNVFNNLLFGRNWVKQMSDVNNYPFVRGYNVQDATQQTLISSMFRAVRPVEISSIRLQGNSESRVGGRSVPWKITLHRSNPVEWDESLAEDDQGFVLQERKHAATDMRAHLSAQLFCLCERMNNLALISRNNMVEDMQLQKPASKETW